MLPSLGMNVSAKSTTGMGKAMCNPRAPAAGAPVVRSAQPVPVNGVHPSRSGNFTKPSAQVQSIAGERPTAGAPAAARPTEWLQKVIELPPYDR
eukprot:1145520-Pelagomonas_calceolata.AAC.4